MTSKQLACRRLELVREDLRAVLGRLSEDILDWSPAPGMRTVGGQLKEIATTETQIMRWLRDGVKEPFEAVEAECERNSLADYVSLLNEVRESTLAWIEAEPDVDAEIAMPEVWLDGLRLSRVPLREVLASIAMHEWYHTGQLVSYVWARGDDPYSW